MRQTASLDEEQKRKKSFAAFQIVDENNCGKCILPIIFQIPK